MPLRQSAKQHLRGDYFSPGSWLHMRHRPNHSRDPRHGGGDARAPVPPRLGPRLPSLCASSPARTTGGSFRTFLVGTSMRKWR
jgi:hypothetical protein